MRLRAELTLGPLYLLFDPWPDEDVEDDDTVQAVTSVEAGNERRDDHANPELHMGFRGGYFEE